MRSLEWIICANAEAAGRELAHRANDEEEPVQLDQMDDETSTAFHRGWVRGRSEK